MKVRLIYLGDKVVDVCGPVKQDGGYVFLTWHKGTWDAIPMEECVPAEEMLDGPIEVEVHEEMYLVVRKEDGTPIFARYIPGRYIIEASKRTP